MRENQETLIRLIRRNMETLKILYNPGSNFIQSAEPQSAQYSCRADVINYEVKKIDSDYFVEE